jgi:hypothetical protein
VVRLLEEPNAEVQQAALAVLMGVARRSPLAIRTAAGAGAIPALVCIMRSPAVDGHRVGAALALSTLVATSANRAREATDAGALQTLCSIMGSPAPDWFRGAAEGASEDEAPLRALNNIC